MIRIAFAAWLLWSAVNPTYGYDPRVQAGCPLSNLPKGLLSRSCQVITEPLVQEWRTQ